MGNVHVLGAGVVTSVNGVSGDVAIGTRNLLTKSALSLVSCKGTIETTEKINMYGLDRYAGSGVSCSTEFPAGMYTVYAKVTDNTYVRMMVSVKPSNGIYTQENSSYEQLYGAKYILGGASDDAELSYTIVMPSPFKMGFAVSFPSGLYHDSTTLSLMLVTGNVLTDWSPAPEDIESRLAAIEAKLGITADPPMVNGPSMEDMDMDDMAHAGGYDLYIVTFSPALIGGVRHG